MPALEPQSVFDNVSCYNCFSSASLSDLLKLGLWDTIASEPAFGPLEILTEDGFDLMDELGAPLLIE
jgi:hypothetical protein